MERWIDFAIVIFIPLMMYRGFRRGGVMMVMTFCTIFVAFFGASFLANNFSDSAGRLLQPIIKEMITEVLEDALKHEDILIEAPKETEVVEENSNPLIKQEYLSLTRALQILTSSRQLSQIEGFVDLAQETLLFQGVSYVGSVTDGISNVIAREISRALIFIASFLVIFILWLLLTRALKLVFKLPGLSQVNVVVGTTFGLFLALSLVYVFAFATRGGILSWESVEKTILYEYFAKYNPLDTLAENYEINLDL